MSLVDHRQLAVRSWQLQSRALRAHSIAIVCFVGPHLEAV